jgi:hypothetical protein
MQAAIHLDLDGATDIFRVHGWSYRGETDPLFETGLRNALDFFDQNQVRATLFVIAQDLTDARKRKLLEEAMRRGHQIGSHSVTHRRLTRLSRAEKTDEIFGSRDRLATALGVEVPGFRAPGFHIDRESLELIAAAGYRYDSSTFPNAASARKIGLTSLGPLPSHPLAGCDLIEFCLPDYAGLPFSFHPCFSLILGTPYFRLGFRRFVKRHRAGAAPAEPGNSAGLAATGPVVPRLSGKRRAPMILLFHLTDFADPLPSSYLPGWRARLYTLSHLSAIHKRTACSQMLQLVRDRFEIVDTAALLPEVTIN